MSFLGLWMTDTSETQNNLYLSLFHNSSLCLSFSGIWTLLLSISGLSPGGLKETCQLHLPSSIRWYRYRLHWVRLRESPYGTKVHNRPSSTSYWSSQQSPSPWCFSPCLWWKYSSTAAEETHPSQKTSQNPISTSIKRCKTKSMRSCMSSNIS